MKKIIILIIITVSINLFGGQQTTNNVKKKIYISKFKNKTKVDKSSWSFYSISLANSIRSTLNKTHNVDFYSTPLSLTEIRKKKYDYIVRGEYSVKDEQMKISFRVIHVKRKITVIIANVDGFSDRRVFDLVDKISTRVSVSVAKPLPAQSVTVVMSINREGRITTAEEQLNNANLQNRDFSERRLFNKNFTGSNLTNVNFKYAILNGATFTKVNLTNGYLRYSKINGSNFKNSILNNADFRDTQAINVNFSNSKINKARFSDASLSGADFNNSSLVRSNFNDARLVNVNFKNANLNRASLNDTILTSSNLSNARLVNASLTDSNLTNANLQQSDMRGANLSGSVLNNANLANAKLQKAKLRNAKLVNANLSGANLSGANLRDANLSGANLSGANLEGADLRDVNLSGVKLKGANLRNANISSTQYHRNSGLFKNANIKGAIFDLNKILIGIDNMLGTSIANESNFSGNDIESDGNFYYELGLSFNYFFTEKIGINAGLAYKAYSFKWDETGTPSNGGPWIHNLKISASFALRLDPFLFLTGFYFDFIFKITGDYEISGVLLSFNKDYFKKVVIGFDFSILFKIRLSRHVSYYFGPKLSIPLTKTVSSTGSLMFGGVVGSRPIDIFFGLQGLILIGVK